MTRFASRFFPTRAAKITTAFVCVYSACIGFVPLFGTPGYEMALGAGLVIPSAAAIWTALDASGNAEISPANAIGKGVRVGFFLAALTLLVSLIHTVFGGACDLLAGISFYGMTAGAGIVLGGLWGGFASELARRVRSPVGDHGARRRRLAAVLLALLGPVGSIVVSLIRFRGSPMIFAYDPFVGYFSGTLYDTIIDPGTPLVTYRVGSLATLVAALLISEAAGRKGAVYTFGARARGRLALGVLCACVSLYVTANGEALHHHSTSASIEEALGGRKNGVRCDVVYPSNVPADEATLLLRDCEEEIASVEEFLGAKGPDKITAFFFRDPAEKRVLMGAEHTYVAKPWRHEVYLQLAAYPHPVLGHELAHVVAGSFGEGPFHVAGSLDGLIPNPGLIEGVAVAASPDDDVLTDDEWARAMKDAKILPPMRQIFSLEFLGASSAKSYTLAGSFIRFLMRTESKETVRAWYAGGDIEALTHKSWGNLEGGYLAFLDTLTLPPEAVRVAEARFGRPGIFGRKCPHVVDEIRRDADRCRDTHDFEKARALYDRAIALDQNDLASKYARAQMIARWFSPDAESEKGVADLTALANDEKMPLSYRDRAEEALGDLDLLAGKHSAVAHYERAHARTLDEDFLRTLGVKIVAADDPNLREVLVPMLIGDATHTPDAFMFGLAMGRSSAKADSPMVRYLIARNYASRNRHADTLAEIDAMRKAASGPPLIPTVTREALRLEAVSACALQDRPRLDRISKEVATTLTGGRRESVERMLARCVR